MGVFITSILIALGVSGFCSLLESVLLSLSPVQVAEISKNRPKIGKIWVNLKQNLEKPIAVILLLNTTAHTIGAAVAGAAFSTLWGDDWIWLFSLIFTFLMLQYTEILPKTLGVRYNQRIAVIFAHPLIYAVHFFSPLIQLVHFFNRPFEPKKDSGAARSTVNDIVLLASLARQRELIGEQEEEIITGAAKLSKKPVTDVMIPIDDVVMIPKSASLREAIELAHADAHTRFPIYEGHDKNDICGYVNFKELISHQRLNPNAETLADIVRNISYILPNKSAAELLRKFMSGHEHIAVVRDSNNYCLGMVTLEDVVEELVGEIEDEFDRLPQNIQTFSNNNLLAGGGCPMRTVVETILKRIPDARLEPDVAANSFANVNLAAWLRTQKILMIKRNDRAYCGNIEFIVRRVRRREVFDVVIQKANPSFSGDETVSEKITN